MKNISLVVLLIVIGCFKNYGQLVNSCKCDTMPLDIYEATNDNSLLGIANLDTNQLLLVFDSGFDEKVQLLANHKRVFKRTLKTDPILGTTGKSFSIKKNKAPVIITVILSNNKCINFQSKPGFYKIHLSKVFDRMVIYYNNNVVGYE